MNWKEFYEAEGRFKRFLPTSDADEAHRVRAVFSIFPRANLSSILEVGVGDGYLGSRYLATGRASHIAGVDLAMTRLTYAKAHFPGLWLFQADISALPFRASSFDLVSAVEILEHIPDPQAALAQMAFVSRRYVLLSVPYNEPVREVLCPHCGQTFSLEGHLHSFDRERIARLAQACGLSIRRIRNYRPTLDNHPILRYLQFMLHIVAPAWFKKGGYLTALLEKREGSGDD